MVFDITSETTGLAQAGTNFPTVPAGAGFGTAEVVRQKAVSNGAVDLNGATADGEISINLGVNFQYNPNAAVDFDGGQFDFFSVMDHEFTHAFGFLSFGEGLVPGVHSKFDQFLTDLNGNKLFNGDGSINQGAYDSASGNLALFQGSNLLPITIQGKDPVGETDGGLSHLGTTRFSFPTSSQNALMLCCGGLVNSFEPRDYNSAEVSILKDIGYTAVTAAVPEPSTYALLFAGLGLVGYTARRRKL